MTTTRRRLQALERRHRERGPCPSCPPSHTVYQDDDGRPCGRYGLPLEEEDQAAPPGPASCPSCGLPARVLVITYTDNWRGGKDERHQWAGSPASFISRAALPGEGPPEGTGAWWLE